MRKMRIWGELLGFGVIQSSSFHVSIDFTRYLSSDSATVHCPTGSLCTSLSSSDNNPKPWRIKLISLSHHLVGMFALIVCAGQCLQNNWWHESYDIMLVGSCSQFYSSEIIVLQPPPQGLDQACFFAATSLPRSLSAWFLSPFFFFFFLL